LFCGALFTRGLVTTNMHPSIHYKLTDEDRVLVAFILWQIVAVFLISLRTRMSPGAFLNLTGLWLWNMVLLAAVDMLVLPPIFAFTHYFYGNSH
jgi:hypothetical protein